MLSDSVSHTFVMFIKENPHIGGHDLAFTFRYWRDVWLVAYFGCVSKITTRWWLIAHRRSALVEAVEMTPTVMLLLLWLWWWWWWLWWLLWLLLLWWWWWWWKLLLINGVHPLSQCQTVCCHDWRLISLCKPCVQLISAQLSETATIAFSFLERAAED